MMEWCKAVHGVTAIEICRSGRAEGRQCPPVVGDLLGLEHTAGFRKDDEGEFAGDTGIRSVPPGQIDLRRIDLLEIDHVV